MTDRQFIQRKFVSTQHQYFSAMLALSSVVFKPGDPWPEAKHVSKMTNISLIFMAQNWYSEGGLNNV